MNNLNKIILLVFIIISFLSLTRNPLLNDDAALYALSAKNIVLFNQWLAPLVTPGDPSSFLDKPPLGIWVMACTLKIFGISEFSIHLPNLFCYALLLGILYWMLVKMGKRKIALTTTAIAATSLALVVYSRTPKLDVLLTLFIMLTHLLFFAWLKKEHSFYLYLAALAAAAGFLVKSGFALAFPGLTALWLLLFCPPARKKMLSVHLIPALFIFLLPIVLVLGLQYLALGHYWISYLKSITIQGKYNTAYLGLGFNLSMLGILLIALFPWTPFVPFFAKIRSRNLTMGYFARSWFLSNFLFLLFFFKLTDFRTFTVLVPPLAILASLRIQSLQINPRHKKWGAVLGNTFFVCIFAAAVLYLGANPHNAQGIDLSAVRIPLLLFLIASIALYYYLLRPKQSRCTLAFCLIAFAYASLFYFALPLARAFNPESTWPQMIREKRSAGYQFFIYRPSNRNLKMSPDLFYPDFMAGPADRYFITKESLLTALHGKTIILSDSNSLINLKLKPPLHKLAQDDYAMIIETLTPCPPLP